MFFLYICSYTDWWKTIIEKYAHYVRSIPSLDSSLECRERLQRLLWTIQLNTKCRRCGASTCDPNRLFSSTTQCGQSGWHLKVDPNTQWHPALANIMLRPKEVLVSVVSSRLTYKKSLLFYKLEKKPANREIRHGQQQRT